ncbi:MAG: hypothetical protein GWO78_04860 [Dehalococcoidales bacterium]|nr:hypothetical protein [Dehalococcoidales bacterium]
MTRRCNNADSEVCNSEYFTAKNRNQFYCSQNCRDDFNNRKKRELRNGNLPIKDGIIVKLQSLLQSNKEVFLTSKQIEGYGIDITKYDEQILIDRKNQRYVLRFGDFYMYRIEDDLFRIITKTENNGKRSD